MTPSLPDFHSPCRMAKMIEIKLWSCSTNREKNVPPSIRSTGHTARLPQPGCQTSDQVVTSKDDSPHLPEQDNSMSLISKGLRYTWKIFCTDDKLAIPVLSGTSKSFFVDIMEHTHAWLETLLCIWKNFGGQFG